MVGAATMTSALGFFFGGSKTLLGAAGARALIGGGRMVVDGALEGRRTSGTTLSADGCCFRKRDLLERVGAPGAPNRCPFFTG